MTELPLVRAARIPVTDTYHGVDVTEDYRWLENALSEETIAWTKAQQQRTRAYFDGIPWRDALRTRVEQLLKADKTTYKRLLSGGNTFFALLLLESTGHLAGSLDQSIEETTDRHAFLFDQLGLGYRRVAPA